MLRTPPKLPYRGITLVLSNPSRFDTEKLLSAGAGHLVNDFCLRPEFNLGQCDIRLADDTTPLLTGTRVVILLGEYALHKFVTESRANILNEMRGSPFYMDGTKIPCIATFFPQDACDPKNWEKTHNDQAKSFSPDGELSEGGDDDEDEGDVKRFANTRRSNYAFWMRNDFKKAKHLILNNLEKWPIEPEPTYHIYPPADTVIDALRSAKDVVIDFDMETNYEEQDCLCFSFSTDNARNIYSVPVLDYNYRWAYSSLPYIFRALVIACSRNTLVAHNGAGFDFLVLGMKYRIPVLRPYDTLVAQHRCYPDVEKSLGHFTSLWTYQKFHKDENPGVYFTQDDMTRMLKYCAKDVFTMSLGRQRLTEHAKRIPGLPESIQCATESLLPYSTCTLQGIPYSEEKRQKKLKENDRLMMQYLRMIKLLVGEQNLETIRKSATKGKSKGVLPSSNPQACYYFHEMLGYPVVNRGKPSKIDGQRKPSLAKKAMYKLRLKHENPVIDLCNAYRAVKLESSTPLGFIPFKDNENKIVKIPTDSPKDLSISPQTVRPSGDGSTFIFH